MNRYKVTTFSFGNSQEVIVESTDILQAIHIAGVNYTEVVKVEFIGSSNLVDLTENQY